MLLFLVICGLVFAAIGAVLGALMTRHLPRAFVVVFLAALLVGAAYQLFDAQSLDEFERAGAHIMAFVVLLPGFIGCLSTASFLYRRQSINVR